MTDVDLVGVFPFGQPVLHVLQKDRTPKRVFVLGVYASAVHARWIGADKKQRVQALAVASEPSIFWTGDGAEDIIKAIKLPEGVGTLEPASEKFNGPSGKALDDLILAPLKLTRAHVWLCDLVPHSCINANQKRAIEKKYAPIATQRGLPPASVPELPKVLADEARRAAIVKEIEESQADVLILLGDLPIRHFLWHFDKSKRRLADFGTDVSAYGRRYKVRIGERLIDVVPVVHPRQAGRLGASSKRWYEVHQEWMKVCTTTDGLRLT